MKINELRIGNWVYDGERTQFPMQVTGIGKDWAHLDFPGNEGGAWEADIISAVAVIDIMTEGGVERSTKIFKRSAVVLAISVLGIVFIPSKQDMFLIYGVGTTLDYLQDNEKVQQLPDKCVDALETWVETLSEEGK